MTETFSNVDWFCDNCCVHLNVQKDFNSNQEYWQCQSCGFTTKLKVDDDLDIDFDSLLGDLKGTSMINLFED